MIYNHDGEICKAVEEKFGCNYNQAVKHTVGVMEECGIFIDYIDFPLEKTRLIIKRDTSTYLYSLEFKKIA